MGYIEKHLISGETILYKTRLHSIAVLVPLLVAAALAIAGGFCLYQSAQDNRTGTGDAKCSQSQGRDCSCWQRWK